MVGNVRASLLLSASVVAGCWAPAPQASSPHRAAFAATPASGDQTPAAVPAAVAEQWPFGPAPSGEEAGALVQRVKAEPGLIKANWVPPGRSERYGHAEALVAVPYAAVRAKLLDYPHYKELAGPKFKNVRVVAKDEGTTELYFNLPIMRGLVTIWYVTRFAPPRAAQGGEVFEGTFVKGNIRGMHIAFTIRKGPDDDTTVLTCDLLLSLNVPAPQANVDEELRDACGDAIVSVRRTTAPPPPP